MVEDSDIKYSTVEGFLREAFPHAGTKRAASYQSGIEALVFEEFDLVILDMTLPNSDIHHSLVGSETFPFGGELILREMKRRRIGVKAIVLTQYDTFFRGEAEVPFAQLWEELSAKFAGLVLGCVRLDSSSVNWETELAALIHNENLDR